MSSSFRKNSANHNGSKASNAKASNTSAGGEELAGVAKPGAAQPGKLSLRQFLHGAVFVGADDIQLSRCAARAELCKPGDVFIPQHSAVGDEHDRIDEAVRRGAVAVVTERLLPVVIPQCLVEDTREAYGRVCQALAGMPSQRMLTIGVVGTHGKTTTALFLSAMLKRLGGAVAYYTSLGASDSTACDRTAQRAPGAHKLANWMEQCELAGAPAMVVELTPNMLRQQVAAGIEFDVLVVTGLRPAQFRGSPRQAELNRLMTRLTDNLKPHGLVLVNADDAQAATWVRESGVDYIDYGLDAAQHVRGKRLSRCGGEQQLLTVCGNMLMPLTLKMPGDHVARAALAAVAAAWVFDFPVPEALAGVEALTTIPGRMQRVQSAVEVPLWIDAAQTPDRVAVALHALRQHQLGPVTVVMDLGPRLDAQWRQRLGEVLDKGAERVVLSAADYSAESTQSMAMDVLGGVQQPGRVQVIADRAAAIEWAVQNTHQGCILLAGCGAACWTERGGQTVADEQIAQRALAKKNSLVKFPALSIFPPAESTPFLSH